MLYLVLNVSVPSTYTVTIHGVPLSSASFVAVAQG